MPFFELTKRWENPRMKWESYAHFPIEEMDFQEENAVLFGLPVEMWKNGAMHTDFYLVFIGE